MFRLRIFPLVRDRHLMLIPRSRTEGQIIGRGKRPVSGFKIDKKGKIFDMVVPIMGQPVKDHPAERLFDVVLIFCEQGRHPKKIGIVTGRNPKVGRNEIAKCVNMMPVISASVKAWIPKKEPAFVSKSLVSGKVIPAARAIRE